MIPVESRYIYGNDPKCILWETRLLLFFPRNHVDSTRYMSYLYNGDCISIMGLAAKANCILRYNFDIYGVNLSTDDIGHDSSWTYSSVRTLLYLLVTPIPPPPPQWERGRERREERGEREER